jgi:SPP1 gp7 family putative phage head morphogenesis protein
VPLSKVLFDSTIELHLDMEMVAIQSRATIVKLLQNLEKELIAKVADGVSDWSKARIAKQLSEADAVIRRYYDDAAGIARDTTTSVAQVSASATTDSLLMSVGNQVAMAAIPTASYLETLAGNTIIQGATQSAWWSRQSEDTAFKFQSAVRQGLVGAETTPQIVKRVRGVLDISKRNAETLVHTSVQSVANTTREKIFADNDDVISGKEWSSALDRRTCPTCGALDGKRWTTDSKAISHSMVYQIPPKHFKCRCSMIPVLKTWKELGINMDELPDGTRASMEGQVTDKTFEDWLKRKTESDPTFADRTLGKGRAELWRNNKITMDQMISGGKPLSLAELKAKYGKAIPAKALPNVSDSFIIPKSGRAYNASKITLAEIDKIHSIENLPVIPIKDSVSVKFQGQYSFYANRNRPIDIKLSKVSVNPEMTLAHEIGHFIDNQVIPKTSGSYSSVGSTIMEEWRLAITNSSATMNLKSMVGNRAFDQKKIRYYLSTEEQWARSYAQWVGQKSGNATMMNQTKAITEHEKNEMYRSSQWVDDDFVPIGAAIDGIFKKLGWLK